MELRASNQGPDGLSPSGVPLQRYTVYYCGRYAVYRGAVCSSANAFSEVTVLSARPPMIVTTCNGRELSPGGICRLGLTTHWATFTD